MHAHVWAPSTVSTDHRDVDLPVRAARQLPEPRRGSMTEHRFGAARHHGRQLGCQGRDSRVSDEVHAPVQAVQAPSRHAVGDRSAAETEALELVAGHKPVLGGGDRRQRLIYRPTDLHSARNPLLWARCRGWCMTTVHSSRRPSRRKGCRVLCMRRGGHRSTLAAGTERGPRAVQSWCRPAHSRARRAQPVNARCI